MSVERTCFSLENIGTAPMFSYCGILRWGIAIIFMEYSYYDLTVPFFIKNLTNLKRFVTLGYEFATKKGMSEAEYLELTLASDMFSLKKQVQVATDNAKGAAARLAGKEPLVIVDAETTVSELLLRIDTIVVYLNSFQPTDFNGAATRKIVLPYMPDQYQYGKDYLIDYALPNFLFHVTVAYSILRKEGVTLGKSDFIGGLKLHQN